MHEIRIRVMPAEILERDAVHDASGARTQAILENMTRVGTRHSTHRVEEKSKSALEECAQRFEIKEILHCLLVVGERIKDHDLGGSGTRSPFAFEVYVLALEITIIRDLQSLSIDALGKAFRGRTAIADVIFDSKVAVSSSGVVAGRKHDPPERASPADHCRHSGCREDSPACH